MAIVHQVLGDPGRDNALHVRVETGQAVWRLLFDCGEGCLGVLPISEIQAIDHLFFSHLHMDHVGGFDSFFRCNFNRTTRPNVIWGPPETAAIFHHRFQGFWWNLHEEQSGTWTVNDIGDDGVESFRFEITEAFAGIHPAGKPGEGPLIFDNADFEVEAIRLEHNGPSMGYLVREQPRQNIRVDRVATLGLRPGPWMQSLKSPGAEGSTVEIDGRIYEISDLQKELLVETAGESIVYLTDFRLEAPDLENLASRVEACTTLVCEAQYREADHELAQRNFHATASRVSELASRAQVGELVLFHLSNRYAKEEWLELLEEARAIFPNTRFPEHWHEIIQD